MSDKKDESKKPLTVSKPSQIFKDVTYGEYMDGNKLFIFDKDNSVLPTKDSIRFYGKAYKYRYTCAVCGNKALVDGDGIRSIKCEHCQTMWDPIKKEFILNAKAKKVDGEVVIYGERFKDLSDIQRKQIVNSSMAADEDDLDPKFIEEEDGTIKSIEEILQENSETPIEEVKSKRKRKGKAAEKTETIEETVDDVLETQPKKSDKPKKTDDDEDENEYLEELPDGLSALELLGLLPDHGDRKSIIHLKPGDIVYYAGKLFMMK